MFCSLKFNIITICGNSHSTKLKCSTLLHCESLSTRVCLYLGAVTGLLISVVDGED